MEHIPPLPYVEHQEDAIDELETLLDRGSFEQLLKATSVERTTAFDIPKGTYVQLTKQALPEDISDQLWFPDKFWIHDMHTQLTELPSQLEANDPSWSLATRFALTRNPRVEAEGTGFTLITTPQQTILLTTNADGQPLTSRPFGADSGQHFLSAVLGAALRSEIPDGYGASTFDPSLGEEISARAGDAMLSPEAIATVLMCLGEISGVYTKSNLAHIPHPELGDRAVVVHDTERSDHSEDQRTLNFYMDSQIISGAAATQARHTAMLSLDHQQIRHISADVTDSRTQYAKRFPTDIPIEDLQFAVGIGMFDHSEERRFDPTHNREHYALVAASIMTVIRPQLARYLAYDLD